MPGAPPRPVSAEAGPLIAVPAGRFYCCAARPSTIPGVEFGIKVVRAEQATTLEVAGEVDLSTAEELTQAGLDALAEGARAVIVDLTDVTFLDSSGLAALITI